MWYIEDKVRYLFQNYIKIIVGTVKERGLYQKSEKARFAFNPCVCSIKANKEKKLEAKARKIEHEYIKEKEKNKELERQIEETKNVTKVKNNLSKSKYLFNVLKY